MPLHSVQSSGRPSSRFSSGEQRQTNPTLSCPQASRPHSTCSRGSPCMNLAEQTEALLARLRGNDGEALGELFMLHRERLWRMLYVRLDRRLTSRVTPDDVIQETFLDVARRIGEYLDKPAVPFYVWLRFLAVQRMQMIQRAHL